MSLFGVAVMIIPAFGFWFAFRAYMGWFAKRLARSAGTHPGEWHHSPTGPKLHGKGSIRPTPDKDGPMI